MSVIRVGSNGNYSAGWDDIFGKGKAGKAKATGKKTVKRSAKKVAKQPAAAKKAVKKKAGKKR